MSMWPCAQRAHVDICPLLGLLYAGFPTRHPLYGNLYWDSYIKDHIWPQWAYGILYVRVAIEILLESSAWRKCALGHMGIWAYGHMGIWAYGHIGT